MKMQDLQSILEGKEFLNVATCNHEGRPNAAPKFLLKVEGDVVYLVDYNIGTTSRNLRINPRASLSFMDYKTLTGYQLNGTVTILEKGRSYQKMCREMIDKEIRLTAQHIIEEVRGQTKRDRFEVDISERFIIFKITIHEIVEIGHRGDIIRSKTPAQ